MVNRKLYNIYDDKNTKMYLSDIRNYPVLSQKEFLRLFKLMKTGNLDAKEKLINCNLKLVVFVAKKYINSNIPFIELIAEGNLGLLNAIENYDINKGYSFSTYATKCIKFKIIEYITNRNNFIKFSVDNHNILNKVKKIIMQFYDINHYFPSDMQIVSLYNKSNPNNKIYKKKLVALKPFIEKPIELNAKVSDNNYGDFQEIQDIIEDKNSAFEDDVINKIYFDSFWNILIGEIPSILSPNERTVLYLKYHENKTINEIMKEIKLKRPDILLYEKTGLKKLRFIINQEKSLQTKKVLNVL